MSDEILPGIDLAREWCDRFAQPYAQVQGTDGIRIGASWVWCEVYMDFDYIQAYLLEVGQDGPKVKLDYGNDMHASEVADQLAVVRYPVTNYPEFGSTIRYDVCWRNKPYERWPGNAESMAISREGWTWFAGWVEAWFEQYSG